MQTQSQNNQPVLQPDNQNEYGYFDAFGDAFQRILNNRILWVWGILLASGGFSFVSDSKDFGGNQMSVDSWERFWWIFPIVVVVGLVVVIGLWFLSTVARPGVIRAIDRLQNNPDSETKHRDIWEQGKMKFVEIVKLDLMVFVISLGVIFAFIISAIIVAILVSV